VDFFLFWFSYKGTLFIPKFLQVIPQLSCPIALFTYYNPILRRGVENYMTVIKNAGVHGTLTFSIFLPSKILICCFRAQFWRHLLPFILSSCLYYVNIVSLHRASGSWCSTRGDWNSAERSSEASNWASM